MADEKFPHLVTARLWEKVQPVARGERYEDPLQQSLESCGLGTVTGGGTQLSETGEIEFADLELLLANLDSAVDFVKNQLEAQGAPAGSELLLNGSGSAVPFGQAEGLAVYFDGVSLPDSVYEEADIDVIYDRLADAVAGIGELRNVWGGAEETAFYFYGDSAAAMWARIQPALEEFPLSQNARVVLRIGNPNLSSSSIRLPRRA